MCYITLFYNMYLKLVSYFPITLWEIEIFFSICLEKSVHLTRNVTGKKYFSSMQVIYK